jgi:hypothetical protein
VKSEEQHVANLSLKHCSFVVHDKIAIAQAFADCVKAGEVTM